MRFNPCVMRFRDQGFSVDRGIKGGEGLHPFAPHCRRERRLSAADAWKRKSAISNHTAAPEGTPC